MNVRPAVGLKVGSGVEVDGAGVGGSGDDVGTAVGKAVAVREGAKAGSEVGLALVASVGAMTVEMTTPGSAASFPPKQEQRPIVAAKTRARNSGSAAGGEDIRLDLTGYDWSLRRPLF